MGPYGFSLALGAVGLAVMAFLGFGHHGGGHSGHHTGHHLTAHGPAHHPGHAAPGASHGHGHDAAGRLIGLLSPRVLFSFLVGLGATGLLVAPFTFEPLTALAAVAGGWGFERYLVGPIWKFLFRFESRPAAMLESALMEEALAVTDFDARGQGLIQIELDGQIVQLLGTVRADDLEPARRIRSGDLLRIEEVDAARNRCTVTFAGLGPPGGRA